MDRVAAVASRVSVPVIASGGAGTAQDVFDILADGRADAALVAGILHDGLTTVFDIKRILANGRISVRTAA
jgi:cyclase